MMDSSTLLEKGIFGKAVIEPTLLKIMEAGYTRIGDLTRTLPDELAANAGIGSDTAMKVIQLAFTHSTNYETGNDVMEAQKDLVRLNTGCTGLNTLLGGGYQSGHITELIGGFGCHSENTKAFTKDGEVKWDTLSIGDTVLGMHDGNIVESIIEDIHCYDYEGDLYHFKTRRVQLEVTPNHDVYYKRNTQPDFSKIRADETRTHGYLLCKFSARGVTKPLFNIHEYITPHEMEHPEKSHPKPKLNPLNTNLLLELMGFYISDGSPLRSKHTPVVYPTIRTEKNLDRLIELVNQLNLDFSIYEDNKVVIFHSDLGAYLLRCGNDSYNKTIPDEIMEFDTTNLQYLFKGLMQCDAHHNGYTYYTISPSLRDRFMILTLKLGYNPTYRTLSPGTSMLKDGRQIIGKHDLFYINISYKPSGYYDSRQKARTIHPYKGKVWCLTTSTGNFFTILNGQPTLSGNSGKTQACFTAAVMCTRPVEEGGLDGSVLWMDTEATFSGKRVAEIASTRGYDVSETLSKIYRVDIANSLHQEALTSNLRIPIQEYGVKLVIVDSMIGKLRGEYIGLQNLSPRQQKLGSMLNHLLRISRPKFGFNIPIIITNQVQTQINVMFGDPNRGAGGNIIAHAGDPRVMLRKGRGDTSLASIIDSSELAPGKVRIRITAGGIMDE